MLDHLEDREASVVLERDDGFVDTDDLRSYFAPCRRWLPCERRAIGLARGRVLDVGCGAGRVPLHLQQRGQEVVAIDISPGALEVSRRRGVRDARRISVTQVDRSLGSFDTIVMFGNNFGVLGSEERARTLLRRFHQITTPKARILVGSSDISGTDDPMHLRYQRSNLRKGRMAGQLRLRVRYLFAVGDWFDFPLVSPDVMRQVIEGTGWATDRVIGSNDPDDGRYVAILRPA